MPGRCFDELEALRTSFFSSVGKSCRHPYLQRSRGDSVNLTVRASADDSVETTSRFIVYYFHTTARCSTCLKIEEQAQEVVEKEFGDEIQSGKLEWQVVDDQHPKNRHFVEDFQLVTKSVVLVEKSGDAVTDWKNPDKVWQLVWNEESVQRLHPLGS